MADGTVEVNSGQLIDQSELTRTDGTVVERQRVVLASDTDTAEMVLVQDGALSVSSRELFSLLSEILLELKQINFSLTLR